MATTADDTPGAGDRQALIRRLTTWQRPEGSQWFRYAFACAVSVVINLTLLGIFWLLKPPATTGQEAFEVATINTQVEPDQPEMANLTNEDLGTDPGELLNYNVNRIEDVSVPGLVNPNEAVGIKDAAEAPALNVPPPPGLGGNTGQGGGVEAPVPGQGALEGFPGGMGGLMVRGGFGGRSGATRERLIAEGGGNSASEAAVARGQRWLADHQARDGHWSLDGFHQHAPGGTCTCRPGTRRNNDIAATALGLLPFLGAGETHRNPKGVYRKNVDLGLKYLISRQNSSGYFGGSMYAHGLATIALCEAYALTGDPQLKGPAQRALTFIRQAQSENGGWRYEPRQGGDTSVVGWQVMALKSGQMAGLEVDDARLPTLANATRFLDSVQTSDGGGYGYMRADAPTPTLSAVGLLCRQYLGWGPRNPGLIAGINRLKQTPPGSVKDIYYYYYATQVMHHMGGEAWEFWNPRMRDLLIKSQVGYLDKNLDPKRLHERGSWSPEGDRWCENDGGGRLMMTSLALLTLEVYYRHLPLYRRDLGGTKTALGN